MAMAVTKSAILIDRFEDVHMCGSKAADMPNRIGRGAGASFSRHCRNINGTKMAIKTRGCGSPAVTKPDNKAVLSTCTGSQTDQECLR
jgi:hypothetical protein